jgi:hypothetical protein
MPSEELIIPLVKRYLGCNKCKVFSHHLYCDACYSKRAREKNRKKKSLELKKKLLSDRNRFLKPGEISKENYFKVNRKVYK